MILRFFNEFQLKSAEAFRPQGVYEGTLGHSWCLFGVSLDAKATLLNLRYPCFCSWKLSFAQLSAKLGSKMLSKLQNESKITQNTPEMLPKGSQETPKTLPRAPKSAPRGSKMRPAAPKITKMAAPELPELQDEPQETPRSFQEAPRSLQEPPRSLQEAPKRDF